MSNESKLRGNAKRRNGPYPLGEFPASLALEIGKRLVHRMAVGQADITGDDFGVIFAAAISADHRGKPLGIADVTFENCAWSVKTVKSEQPFTQSQIRVISGRNSPHFSAGISDHKADIQATGKAVLNIWNARVNEALREYDDLRIFLMLRNFSTLEFTIFEEEATRFIPANYKWHENKRGNLIGVDTTTTEQMFTWQPSGGQFTVHHRVPASAYRFRIKKRPTLIQEHHVLNLVKYENDWIIPFVPPSAGAAPCALSI